MIEIRNLQFQPLTFNLAGEKTLHLGPRMRETIAKKKISAELQAAGKRGVIVITELPQVAKAKADQGKTSKGRK